jgi:hypothetical protein
VASISSVSAPERLHGQHARRDLLGPRRDGGRRRLVEILRSDAERDGAAKVGLQRRHRVARQLHGDVGKARDGAIARGLQRAGSRFMGGLPRKRATKVSAGCGRPRAAADLHDLALFMMQMRSPMVIASTGHG